MKRGVKRLHCSEEHKKWLEDELESKTDWESQCCVCLKRITGTLKQIREHMCEKDK